MKTHFIFIAAITFLFSGINAQTKETGPYTVSTISPGVFHIEDANKSNPAGPHTGADGVVSTNNCSDMYVVQGTDKILLIDLSNFIRWDTGAVQSLRSITNELRGGRKLYITVTHNHGDHLGMLPAFKDDPGVTFWIPAEEFKTRPVFPDERTIKFEENASLDLGNGVVVNTFEVPGHTAHSTIFFLKEKNLVFTGDAIGSGNGVWLFNYDSFITYRNSIDRLIKYIKAPDNKVNTENLTIYGGHYWQKGNAEKLTSQYIFDMQTLIGKIGNGEATKEKVTYNKYLDTNFKYGTATITWNEADALRYREVTKVTKVTSD
ncbi:MAG TPA: MBL fold metallo-hydrolase [Bacteroidales bacterium]|nr:MBL fold metallo-hydrolase [Bacteroidales bacterium]